VNARRPRRRGFTLVEILVSLAILVAATVLIFGSYHQVLRIKRKGEVLLDRARQTDWVMDQLVTALRSTVFLDNNPRLCGFWLEDDDDRHPADVISWITSSAAFMPPQSQMAYGLHRIFLSIEDDEHGQPALHATAHPYLTDSEADDYEKPESWLISRRVVGLNCRVYDAFNEEWADEWEKENSVPSFVEITLFVQAAEEGAEVREITRVVQVPAGGFARNRNRLSAGGGTGTEGNRRGNSDEGAAADPGGVRTGGGNDDRRGQDDQREGERRGASGREDRGRGRDSGGGGRGGPPGLGGPR
jgi:prepilin-type N-terminal cleavage/methylation domain-containing protein